MEDLSVVIIENIIQEEFGQWFKLHVSFLLLGNKH